MQCKELEAVLEREGLSPLPVEAREHLAACSNCQDLLADLSAVVVAAKRLPAEVNPPDRLWISLRAQLKAEGIVRETQLVVAPSPASWWRGFSQLLRPRVLATVGAGLLFVLGSVYFAEHRGGTPSAKNNKPSETQVVDTAHPSAPLPARVIPVVPSNVSPKSIQTAQNGNHSRPRRSTNELLPSPSENAYLGDSAAVLSKIQDDVPRNELANNAAVDASLRQNLRTLNEFIAECETRLKQNPQDQLTREYLNMAYQQKAELLTAMMDSGRSEH
jgi:hypothetical protein